MMYKNLIGQIPRSKYTLIAAIGLLSSLYAVMTNTNNGDTISRLLRSHFPVLVSQNIVFIIIAVQVLSMRKVFPLIALRGQDTYMQWHIIKLVVFETILYFVCFYMPFCLSPAPIFKDGPALIGALVLLARCSFICLLAMVLAGMFNATNPQHLLLTVLISSLLYHYVFEIKFLFIQYSPIYDPLYRMTHLTNYLA